MSTTKAYWVIILQRTMTYVHNCSYLLEYYNYAQNNFIYRVKGYIKMFDLWNKG